MENKTKNNDSEKQNKPHVWHSQQELILKNWSEIGSSYRYLHDKSFIKYNSQNLRFALPVIIISTITGTANFAQESFPESWKTYVPLGIGFLNLTAGLITTIAQFLRVSELLEGHRAASIAYSKFSRNISVELSLPIDQRTTSGFDFIVQCRSELDRLIEQSPNIPISIVDQFGKKFKETAFFKPDILDITPVVIYHNDEERERQKRKELLKLEAEERKRIIQEEEEKRKKIINQIELDNSKRELELKETLNRFKQEQKPKINISNINDSMDKLMKDLEFNKDKSSTNTLNNFINPIMSNHDLSKVITDDLNIDSSLLSNNRILKDSSHPVHSDPDLSPSIKINISEAESIDNNDNIGSIEPIIQDETDTKQSDDTSLDINNNEENESVEKSDIDNSDQQNEESADNSQDSNDSIENNDQESNAKNTNLKPLGELERIHLKKQKRDNRFYYFDYKNNIVYNTKYIRIGTVNDTNDIIFD